MTLNKVTEFMIEKPFTDKVNNHESRISALETPLTQADAIGEPIRWDEFSVKHNNDGTFKTGIITGTDIAGTTITASNIVNGTITTSQISSTAGITGTQLANGTVTNAQISATAGIVASKLAIQKMYKKSTSANPSVTIDTFGTVVDLTPSTDYVSINPLALDVVFGGTFGAETVTADITVTFSDATTATITKTATATGTTSLTNTDLMALVKDGVYINKLSVKSKSSIASTTATVTFNHYGFYL